MHLHGQTAAEIVNNVMKKLVGLAVDGAKVLDIFVEGDKLVEAGPGAVYNKSVKGVKVGKGASSSLVLFLSRALAHGLTASILTSPRDLYVGRGLTDL